MNKNAIIEKIFRERLVENVIVRYQFNRDLKKDFIQEIYMILLEYSEEKLIELYSKNQLKYFIIRICVNQFKSKTSPFYRKYIRYNNELINNNFILEESEKF